MKKKWIRGSGLFFCAFSVTSASALASPILYSVTDTGSGTLGSTAFTNQTVTVSFAADTNNLTGSSGFYADRVGTGYLEIGNSALVVFTDSTLFFFDNQSQEYAGIAASLGSILDTQNAAFETYTGSVPYAATSGPVFFNSTDSFTTSAGAFILSSAGATSTFSATVPEPVPLAFLGLMALAFSGTKRPPRGVMVR